MNTSDLVRPHVREALERAGIGDRELDELTERASHAARITGQRIELPVPGGAVGLDDIDAWVNAFGNSNTSAASYGDIGKLINVTSRRTRR